MYEELEVTTTEIGMKLADLVALKAQLYAYLKANPTALRSEAMNVIFAIDCVLDNPKWSMAPRRWLREELDKFHALHG